MKDLVRDLVALGWDGTVYQVKEKFGGLRFYIEAGSEEIHQRILQAERRSYLTCEECGRPGLPNREGWIRTLCEECRTAWKASTSG